MDSVIESGIERRLKYDVEKLDGLALKFTGLGYPDRMILLPEGRIFFVELKAPGKKPTDMQEYRAAQLRKLGFTVLCIDSIEKVRNFINAIQTT